MPLRSRIMAATMARESQSPRPLIGRSEGVDEIYALFVPFIGKTLGPLEDGASRVCGVVGKEHVELDSETIEAGGRFAIDDTVGPGPGDLPEVLSLAIGL